MKKKIVLRFNEIGCMTCVFREIKNIDSLALKIGYDKILIFASYHSERDLQSFKRINGITCPVYNLPMGALNNEIENYNIPYLFVMDETLSASHLFIPQKGLPTLSKDYFQCVSQLF